METTKEIKLETKCPKCEHIFLTTFEESESGLPEAKLQEDYAKLDEENKSLKGQVAHFESEEHAKEVIAHFLNNLDSADPDEKVELGVKLGLDKMFKEGEAVTEGRMAESEEEVGEVKEPVAEVSEPVLPELVWDDPKDPVHYSQHDVLPCWVLKPEEKVA